MHLVDYNTRPVRDFLQAAKIVLNRRFAARKQFAVHGILELPEVESIKTDIGKTADTLCIAVSAHHIVGGNRNFHN